MEFKEFKGKEEINQVLSALGEQLSALKTPHLDLLVCGGSALHALRLVRRATKDVDVVALVTESPTDGLVLSQAAPLPPHLVEAAKKVARDFQLPNDWINPEPASMLQFGLPEGVLKRVAVEDYGAALTIRFIGRYDQIHFKLYAAVDQDGKHYADLRALHPTAQELEQAARWSMAHDVSEGYRGEVKRILATLGHKDVAERL